MWPQSTAPLTPTSDDYGSPKSGILGNALPAFQRLTTSVHYSSAPRTTAQYYGSHVSITEQKERKKKQIKIIMNKILRALLDSYYISLFIYLF